MVNGKGKAEIVGGGRVTLKEERAALNDINMNCNACLNLVREKHEKDKWGFLYGRCDSTEPQPYPRDDGLIKFHPNDWMGMRCFVNRDTGKPSDLSDQLNNQPKNPITAML